MKNIARRIIAAIFPRRRSYAATVSYSGMIFHISIDAPSEYHARLELDSIADGGCIVSFDEL